VNTRSSSSATASPPGASCSVAGGWCLVLRAWYLVLGWWLVLPAWCLVLGAWCLLLGARCLALGACGLRLGPWFPRNLLRIPRRPQAMFMLSPASSMRGLAGRRRQWHLHWRADGQVAERGSTGISAERKRMAMVDDPSP
jgi:hypothetical protein